MSLSNFAENELLDALLGVGSYVTTTVYVSLHTGDPGETGASESTGGGYARQTAAWNAASGGSSTNSGTISYTNMPASTVSHFGLWDSLTVGNFLGGGALGASRVFAGGENASFGAGDITVSLD